MPGGLPSSVKVEVADQLRMSLLWNTQQPRASWEKAMDVLRVRLCLVWMEAFLPVLSLTCVFSVVVNPHTGIFFH